MRREQEAAIARIKAEAEATARAEMREKARLEEERRVREEHEAKVRAQVRERGGGGGEPTLNPVLLTGQQNLVLLVGAKCFMYKICGNISKLVA